MIRKLFSSTTIAFILLLCSCDCVGLPLCFFCCATSRSSVASSLQPCFPYFRGDSTLKQVLQYVQENIKENVRLKNFFVLLNGCCYYQHLTPQLNHTCFKLTKKFCNINNLTHLTIYVSNMYNIRKLFPPQINTFSE